MAKVTRLELQRAKQEQRRIAVVTAYDYWGARLVDRAGADAILVGDSLGNVIQGHESTLPVTLEHMIYHTSCVSRARPQAMVVADLPFGTFQRGATVTLDASIRLVQEAGAEAVKVEGAGPRLAGIEAVAQADIPVWGHLGLTPQSVHRFGGYRVQGREDEAAKRILDDARRVESAGACALVLECIPFELAREITEALQIPTIGIGAGMHCDGQVLVFHDILGFDEEFVPRFVKHYANLGEAIPEAIGRFVAEVREGRFPTEEHSYRGPNAGETKAGRR